MSTARVDFTRSAADRIANVVRLVEQGNRDGSPLRLGRAISQESLAKVFRVCTFTGSWSKQDAKTVTFYNQTSTPNTVSAINLFAEISTSSITNRNCAIARDGTAWFLIAAECD